MFDKLKADLGKAMFTLPAVTGVEYGAGFGVATARGSQNNDTFTTLGRSDHDHAPTVTAACSGASARACRSSCAAP